MCGIVGYIGEPKDQRACYDLTTSLLVKTEVRGDDAAGYWASDASEDGAVYWSKAPQKSSLFVKSDAWTILKSVKTNLFVGHCRRSTVKGSENINRNNHPFLTDDNRTALVHNGNVPEFEALRDGYNIISACDSEILLRMVERGSQYDLNFIRHQLGKLKADSDGQKKIEDCKDEEIPSWAWRVSGLIDIFARINYGAMAVAIGDRWPDGTRALWLFRDRDRPLYVVDLRETMGQVYAVSEKRIWREAVDATPTIKRYVKGNTPIIEFPPMFIWLLTYRDDEKDGKFKVRKFRINRQRRHNTTFEDERPKELQAPIVTHPLRLVTNLNHQSHEHSTSVPKANLPIALPAPQPKDNPPKDKKKDNPKPKNASTGVSCIADSPTDTKDSVGQTSRLDDRVLAALESPRSWPTDCYQFMNRYIEEYTERAPQQKPMNAEQLEKAADGACIADPNVLGVSLSKEDYLDWDKKLKDEFDWYDRRVKGEISALWTALEEARQAWLLYMDTLDADVDASLEDAADDPPESPPFSPTTKTDVANLSDANEQLQLSPPDRLEVRTDHMTVQRTSEEPSIDPGDMEEYTQAMIRIRQLLEQIDTSTTTLIHEGAMLSAELRDIINTMQTVGDDLEGQKFVVQNIGHTASA